jgi:hypothetical protein
VPPMVRPLFTSYLLPLTSYLLPLTSYPYLLPLPPIAILHERHEFVGNRERGTSGLPG